MCAESVTAVCDRDNKCEHCERDESSRVAACLARISHDASIIMFCLIDASHYFRLLIASKKIIEDIIDDNGLETKQYKNVSLSLLRGTMGELQKAKNAFNNFSAEIDGGFCEKIDEIESLIKRIELQNENE